MTSLQAHPSAARNADETQTTEPPVVLSVAFPYAPVGSVAVGGAEVILSGIEAALPELGFDSVVVAHAASRPQGKLYPVEVPPGEITEALRAEVERAQQAALDRALAENPVALVHMHGLDFARYRIPPHLPVIVTLHLPPSWYPETIWSLPANYRFVCVSETERRACPEPFRDRVTVIANGVALPDVSTLRPGGKYALMMSRICPEKNLHTGLDAAQLAGLPAMLAGDVFPYLAHQRYFAEEIEPRVTHAGNMHQQHARNESRHTEARFSGPVSGAAKHRLLARAACLLLPSLAPETSSLAAMEALAAGVPVVAMNSGALPEIVEDGVTGYLVDAALGAGPEAARAMAHAIGKLPGLDHRVCRLAAEQRFDIRRMLREYAALYRQLALRVPELHVQGDTSSAALANQAQSANPALAASRPTAEWLTDPSALQALSPEWTSLWQNDSRATPFQHPAWLVPWWQQFGTEGELHTVALRGEAQKLLALLPLYVCADPRAGVRKLLWVGAGTSDHLDGLFDGRGDPGLLARIALQAVVKQHDAWQTVALTQIPSASPMLAALREPALAEQLSSAASEPCSVIEVDASLPARVRANCGRYRRRAEATGQLSFSVAETAAEALATFDTLACLHRERWEARGETGVLADPRVLGHHRAAIPVLLDAGLLRLFRMDFNGERLGILYALGDPPSRARRTLYLYLIGFDTRFADLSPGTLLLHAVWEYARNNGFSRLDLLRGGESYKELWGARAEPTFAIVSAPGKLK